MKKYKLLFVMLFTLSFVMLLGFSAQLQAEETVKCAVSGKEMKKAEAKGSHEYEGKTYYFCCDNCKKSFLENPEKYTKEKSLEGHGHEGHMHGEEHAEDTVMDPACGMKIKKADAKATYEHNGKTYYFCTEECKEKFVKDPGKYIRADDKMATCPVSGETFNKSDETGSMEYKGKTYYFCCANCMEKFKKDPEKFIK